MCVCAAVLEILVSRPVRILKMVLFVSVAIEIYLYLGNVNAYELQPLFNLAQIIVI